MLELQRLTSDHLEAVLVFELENRAYLARSVTDRGDQLFETFTEDHRALLDEQDAGICVSQRVLEKVGFASTGTCVVGGKRSLKFTRSLADVLS